MSFEASDKYTDSALRVGDTAHLSAARLVGEFISHGRCSNEWVNEEYIHLILKYSSVRR